MLEQHLKMSVNISNQLVTETFCYDIKKATVGGGGKEKEMLLSV